jgi:hypothetical protein
VADTINEADSSLAAPTLRWRRRDGRRLRGGKFSRLFPHFLNHSPARGDLPRHVEFTVMSDPDTATKADTSVDIPGHGSCP